MYATAEFFFGATESFRPLRRCLAANVFFALVIIIFVVLEVSKVLTIEMDR